MNVVEWLNSNDRLNQSPRQLTTMMDQLLVNQDWKQQLSVLNLNIDVNGMICIRNFASVARNFRCSGCAIFLHELNIPLKGCPRRLCDSMLCFQADSTVIEFKNLQCACQKHLTFRYLRQQQLQQLEEQKNQEDWELASESEEEGEEEERHDNEDQHEQQHDDEPSPVLKYVNYLNNHDLSLVPGKCSKTMSSLLTNL